MFESGLLARIDYQTPLPSFVELQLGKYVKQSVRQALDVCWQLAADRFPTTLAPTLPYRGLVLWCGSAAVDFSLLRSGNHTFGEWLLMQRRDRVEQLDLGGTVADLTSTVGSTSLWNDQNLRFSPMSARGRWLSLLGVTVLPGVYQLLRSRYDEVVSTDAEAQALVVAREQRYPWLAVVHRVLKYLFPILHVITEVSQFLFDVAYLLEKTPFASLWLWLLNVAVRRARLNSSSGGSSSPRGRVIVYTLLVLASYGIRLFQTTFRRTGSGGSTPAVVVLPPPPSGTSSPSTTAAAGLCPVCERALTNTAVNVASGVVGCFPCLQSYIQEHGKCPTTRVDSRVEQIRRLYEG